MAILALLHDSGSVELNTNERNFRRTQVVAVILVRHQLFTMSLTLSGANEMLTSNVENQYIKEFERI